MQDLEKLAQELRQKGKTEELRALADSADGRRLGARIDDAAVEKALRSGDNEALRQILQGVLRTDEGQRLAENLRRMMQSGRK